MSTETFSYDDAEPFHFAIEPNAVNDQGNRANERGDCSGEVDWRVFYEIDPNAPRAATEREESRENNEDNMETFKGHLTDDWIVPGKKSKPEKPEDEKTSKNEDPINQSFFSGKMHENGANQTGFDRGYQHGHADICFARPEIDVGKRHG
jgi:hypothetical protein